jgi:hypothetical protein
VSRYSRVVITFGDLLEVVIPEDQFDVSNCANVERLNRQRQLQKYDQAVDERRNERGNERRTERRQVDQAIKPRILAIDNTVLAACIRLCVTGIPSTVRFMAIFYAYKNRSKRKKDRCRLGYSATSCQPILMPSHHDLCRRSALSNRVRLTYQLDDTQKQDAIMYDA